MSARPPNPLTGLHKGHPASTPIPPSLQAKMAAFANRAGPPPALHPVLPVLQTTRPQKPPQGMAVVRLRGYYDAWAQSEWEMRRDVDVAVFAAGDVEERCGDGGEGREEVDDGTEMGLESRGAA